MKQSILSTIKKLIGISEEITDFDADIIVHINSVFAALNQMGIGPKSVFQIEDSSSTWDEFIGDNCRLPMVKSYMSLKVRMLFDPPTGQVAQAFNEAIKEYEWRMYAEFNYSESDKGGWFNDQQ